MESLTKLKQTLTAMLEVHQQLLELAREKQSILVEGKAPELQKVISKEGKLSIVIQTLELQREQQVREFFIVEGINTGKLTMKQVVKLVNDPKEKHILTTLTEKLRRVVMDLSTLNKNNQQLIQISLSYIQYSMNLMLPKEPTIGYGKKPAPQAFKFLDAKI